MSGHRDSAEQGQRVAIVCWFDSVPDGQADRAVGIAGAAVITILATERSVECVGV